ncbi:hypothetical protein OESDEN_22578 [Oesophagostomum dentatum]|uniref:Uncharacterized protein n=1 Tax=Oesophagostomum dentatum TaxID=61180 RepID=A0A0B1S2S9_OESDE|nr:hypothetical protein OESDEN_22578 [Oesophagostomum dentatum]
MPSVKPRKADQSQLSRNRTATSTTSKMKIVVPKLPNMNGSLKRKAFTPSPSNKKLIEYMRNKTRTTTETETG